MALSILQAIHMGFEAVATSKFNQAESRTGLHMNPVTGIIYVTDIQKVTNFAMPGSQISGVDGHTLTLGSDRQWRDEAGNKVTVFQDKNGTVHIKGNEA
jgi:hypothetical protein